jgi:hypothetical protein
MVDGSLLDVLRPAFKPCPNFKKACKGYCRWIPRKGHVPRGFGGATGAISDIRLILVTAEPGDPDPGEKYSDSPDSMLQHSMCVLTTFLEKDGLRSAGQTRPFHRNLRKILKLCWPQDSFEDQLRKTWVTPSFLCSAKKPGGYIRNHIEDTCVSTYLVPQIDLLENAFVLALGEKAIERLRRNGIRMNRSAKHPAARAMDQPEESWKKAARAFRRWLKTHPAGDRDVAAP